VGWPRMAIWIKIVIEIIVGIVVLISSINFWQCVKSPIFWNKTLTDRNELKRIFDHIGIDSINEFNSQWDSNSVPARVITTLKIEAGKSAINKAQNMLLIVVLICLVGSYFVGMIPFIINVVLFLLTYIIPIGDSAKNNIARDIGEAFSCVVYWNKIDQSECRDFCNYGKYKYLSGLYAVVDASELEFDAN
jgi:hypothetical protein